MANDCLMGTGFPFRAIKTVLKLDRCDGCTTLWTLNIVHFKMAFYFMLCKILLCKNFIYLIQLNILISIIAFNG